MSDKVGEYCAVEALVDSTLESRQAQKNLGKRDVG